MKTITLLLVILAQTLAMAQSPYEKGMVKALTLYQEQKVDEASNLFERIGKAEQDKWIPYYYVAMININKSWMIKDEAIIKAQLDKAQEYLNLAMTFSKDNPEIKVLQAYLYTVWVAYDGQRFGMTYAPKVGAIYEEALALDPKNPRVLLSKAEWDMGSAKFFGQDTSSYCKQIASTIPLFDSYTKEEPFYPMWGKNRAIEVSETCKE